jgi:SAM-dependent methyltransferase
MDPKEIKKAVRDAYAKAAAQGSSCCGSGQPVQDYAGTNQKLSKAMGYSEAEMGSVPEGANLGLGCGNPVAIASLKPGQTVVDLGAGAGFDCFLAAQKVEKSGRIIGVDMTPEMIDKARQNAEKGGYENVEFRLGEIEHLPVADNAADVVISNCVINLAADKAQVLKEAYRVLKPAGRIAISDLALLKELPPEIRASVEVYTGCIGGAILIDEYRRAVAAAGFREVKFEVKTATDMVEAGLRPETDTERSLADYVASVYITGYK